ncbi:MAG: hypothetical protein SGI90_00270 [Candidatus Eisenbacteria bacterium]|nr:hypothetical protein [Candidatus Eisenbacteria bacterium]
MRHLIARAVLFGGLLALPLFGGTLVVPTPVHANINVGDTAPAFTKNALDAPPPAARSLSDYPGKVIILFLLGYN